MHGTIQCVALQPVYIAHDKSGIPGNMTVGTPALQTYGRHKGRLVHFHVAQVPFEVVRITGISLSLQRTDSGECFPIMQGNITVQRTFDFVDNGLPRRSLWMCVA